MADDINTNDIPKFEPVDQSIFAGAVNDPGNTRAKPRYDWETPPPPIPEEMITETLEADVVVIGAGIAGLAAGARCTELGMSVIVVDKHSGLVAHGAHIACLDSPVMRELGVVIDKEEFARRWMHTSGSRVNEDLLWLYINKGEEAVQWLLDLAGGECELHLYGGQYKGPEFTEYAATHYFERKPGSHYKWFGAFLFCEILQEAIIKGGSRIVRKTRAEQLERANGRVTGFIAKGEDGKYRRFAGKKSRHPSHRRYRRRPRDAGQILPPGPPAKEKTAISRPGSTPATATRWLCGPARGWRTPAGALSLHLISYAMYSFFFLHVNRRGCRFMNEDTWSQAKSIRILMQPQWGDGDWAWSVFDSKWFEDIGERIKISGGQFCEPLLAEYGQPWDDNNGVKEAIDAYIKKGACHVADTLEELAAKMDVPAETFTATVNRYKTRCTRWARTRTTASAPKCSPASTSRPITP